jgi:uridine phosphorylase
VHTDDLSTEPPSGLSATVAPDRPTYPNFAGKHAHDAFISPAEYLAYLRARGRVPDLAPLEGVVLLYQQSILRRIVESEPTELHRGWVTGEFRLLKRADRRVGVCGGFGIGAPVVAIVIEELIALGVTRFIALGTAGTIQRQVAIGEIVICDRAIRDEGVSHHYISPARYARPSEELTNGLAGALKEAGRPFRVGGSWTIDTPYRETAAEARHYQREGILTVEMEAAAVFAVAEHRGVQAAAAFAISDSLADLVWNPQFDSAETQDGLDAAFEAAVSALSTKGRRVSS